MGSIEGGPRPAMSRAADGRRQPRLDGQFPLPAVLAGVPRLSVGDVALPERAAAPAALKAYPLVYKLPRLCFDKNKAPSAIGRRLTVGFVLAGGLAPGSVEIITGLWHCLKRWNNASTLLGFRLGFAGLFSGDHLVVDQRCVQSLLHEEGLACVGSGQSSLPDDGSASVMAKCVDTCRRLALDGLVVLGGVDTLTDTCAIAQHCRAAGLRTCVLTAPKNLALPMGTPAGVDVGYGFDSTSKHFSWLVGNLCADVSSAKSSYHFVRLMADKDSMSVLETALDVHPNVAFIGEEVRAKRYTLHQLVEQICDVACERATWGANYGVVLMPEGILTSVVEVDRLLEEISKIVGKSESQRHMEREDCLRELSDHSRSLALRLPEWFLEQVMSQRTVRSASGSKVRWGSVQVERLFAGLVARELEKRKKAGLYVGKFASQTMFYGYEARCQRPSFFDCCLGNCIGATMQSLIEQGHSGYLVTVRDLSLPVGEWKPQATPLTTLMTLNRRGEPRVRYGQVDLNSYAFRAFAMLRDGFVKDSYRFSVGVLSGNLTTVVQLNDLQRRHDQEELLRDEERLKELIAFVRRLSLQHNAFMEDRLAYVPPVPSVLRGSFTLDEVPEADTGEAPLAQDISEKLGELFPAIFGTRKVYRVRNNSGTDAVLSGRQLRVGIVLSGGPAPGGHNVIGGLHDFLKAQNAESVLLGFLNGPDGLLRARAMEITAERLAAFRNQGGFNMIGSSRTKIESPEQFAGAASTVRALRLDGLIICGGDDSNTNAALLADYFQGNKVPCQVVGMPKTIDADLRTEAIEMSFGFDTACKVYSTLIANVMLDAQSRRGRWHFIRLMGRSASHIALECALQTRPNYALVSEEVERDGLTVLDIAKSVADVVVRRAQAGLDYGVVLVPEGLIEVTRDLNSLMKELNEQLARDVGVADIATALSPESRAVFRVLPDWLKTQLMSERDPHGNVRVSLIESERLLASLVSQELQRRSDYPSDKEFNFWCHFLGYQGRCSLVSNFDCDYCYVLGHLGGALISGGATGVIAAVRNVCKDIESWELMGVPLVNMMNIERRKGKDKAVIRKKLVDLDGPVFGTFARHRDEWAARDYYPRRSELDPWRSAPQALRGLLDHSPPISLLLERGLLAPPPAAAPPAASPAAAPAPKL